jgi:GntR family transcriptional regulator
MPDEPTSGQIAEDLHQKIKSGQIGSGDQLPTELDLREQYDAPQSTVRAALKLLTTRGLVETRLGEETFVVAEADRRAGIQKLSGTGPMYRQIAEDLRKKIESGELGHGTQLPTELDLREQYDASRNTVRDAVKLLIARRLVETRPGQGTFVVAKIDPYVTLLTVDSDKGGDEEGPVYLAEVRAKRRTPVTTEPRVEIQKAAGARAEELQVADDVDVVCRHQQRYIDGTPWSLQTSFYPMTLAQQGAVSLLRTDNIKEGVVAYLLTALGLKQAGYRDMIAVRAPDATEAAFFRLPDDGRVAVFEVRRTAFDEEGKPFRLTVSVYPADRNRLEVKVGEVPGDLAESNSADTEDPPSRVSAAQGESS